MRKVDCQRTLRASIQKAVHVLRQYPGPHWNGYVPDDGDQLFSFADTLKELGVDDKHRAIQTGVGLS